MGEIRETALRAREMFPVPTEKLEGYKVLSKFAANLVKKNRKRTYLKSYVQAYPTLYLF